MLAAPAAAGPIVDPSTLQPPPNAVCREDGRKVTCDTFLDEVVVNEPILDFELPCGTIYETSHFHGAGIRWYVVDGRLVKGLVVADLHGSWSLSPAGAEPTVTITGTGASGRSCPYPVTSRLPPRPITAACSKTNRPRIRGERPGSRAGLRGG